MFLGFFSSMGQNIFRWGIVGAGKEVEAFADALNDVIDAKLESIVWNEDQMAHLSASLRLAKQVYTSFDDLVLDESIDLIYVASPLRERLTHIKAALACKKGVVYAPMTEIDKQEWADLCATAEAHQLLLLEGMALSCLPPLEKVKKVITQGSIGELCSIQADASQRIAFDPQHTFFSTQSGGIFRHHGMYPLFFAMYFLGSPDQISGQIRVGVTGIEEQYALIFHYNKGMYALLTASAVMQGSLEAHLIATKSRVQFQAPFYEQTKVLLFNRNRPSGLMKFNYPSSIYYELIQEAQVCYSAKRHESSSWTHAQTRKLSELIERCRADSIRYQESIDERS